MTSMPTHTQAMKCMKGRGRIKRDGGGEHMMLIMGTYISDVPVLS
jgi:hypothetical protein